MVFFIHGHRTLKAPHPVRSAQLTRVPPSQYHGGGPRGNPGCCGFFFCLFFLQSFAKFFCSSQQLVLQVSQMKLCFAADLVTTPCGIWPQQDLRVRFSYLEERRGRKGPSRKRRACILGSCHAEMASQFMLLISQLAGLRLVRLVKGFSG